MRTNQFPVWAALVAASVLPCSAWAAVAGVETYDTDTAGFVPNTLSSTVVHIGAGGNPGGFIETRKDLSPPVFDVGAMTTGANFTGDYAAAGIAGASVDLNFMTSNIDGAWLRFRPSIVENGWRFPLTNAFPTNTWTTYSVDFDPTWTDLQAKAAGWVTDKDVDPATDPSGAFAALMSGVFSAEVRLASVGSTLAGIDNFTLRVPEPASMVFALLGGGALIARRRRR